MATLAEAIKDKRSFPDAQEITMGDFKTTLGELRQLQEATGQDVAKAIEIERQKLESDRAEVRQAQEAVVAAYQELQKQQAKPAAQPSSTQDWTKDPFFAPVADYLKNNIESSMAKQAQQIEAFQKALGLGVKYITDVISEQRYSGLPEDFRKEMSFDQAVKLANDKKYLDQGGVPDVRKAYDEWRTPRERDAERKKIESEAYERAKSDLMKTALPRPGAMAVAPQHDPNAPKDMRESFNRLKEDPQFMELIYGMGQGNA